MGITGNKQSHRDKRETSFLPVRDKYVQDRESEKKGPKKRKKRVYGDNEDESDTKGLPLPTSVLLYILGIVFPSATGYYYISGICLSYLQLHTFFCFPLSLSLSLSLSQNPQIKRGANNNFLT